MNKLKYFCISVDGMPYSGKSTICKYLQKFTKKYMVIDSGLIKSATIARCMYNSEFDYSKCNQTVIVYLLAVKEDWNARCDNPQLEQQYDKLVDEMNKTAQLFEDNKVKILIYNTSKYTPYLIAKDILMQLDKLNQQNEQVENETQQQQETIKE